MASFDQENIVPEELTQLALGKIVQEKYPELELEDQEAVRQHMPLQHST